LAASELKQLKAGFCFVCNYINMPDLILLHWGKEVRAILSHFIREGNILCHQPILGDIAGQEQEHTSDRK